MARVSAIPRRISRRSSGVSDAAIAARQAGKFVVVKVNTDVLTDLGDRFGIRSIPTMAVFGGGREQGRTAGARPAADIEAFIQSTLARG